MKQQMAVILRWRFKKVITVMNNILKAYFKQSRNTTLPSLISMQANNYEHNILNSEDLEGYQRISRRIVFSKIQN